MAQPITARVTSNKQHEPKSSLEKMMQSRETGNTRIRKLLEAVLTILFLFLFLHIEGIYFSTVLKSVMWLIHKPV